MGVSSVGAEPVVRKPYVFPNVNSNTSAEAVGNLNAYVDRVLPSGWWELQTIMNGYLGSIGTGSGASYAQSQPKNLRFYSSATGKPLLTLAINNQYSRDAGPFYLPEEAYFDIYSNGSNLLQLDVTFYPVDMPFNFEGMGSLLGPTDSPPTSTSTTISFTSFTTNGTGGVGYDYDNDTLFYITPTTMSTPVGSYQIARAVRIVRLSRGATKYSDPIAITFNSTNSYWSAVGYGINGYEATEFGYTQFFIKNNELHMLSAAPIYSDGSTTISGWAKVDCSTSGSKNFALGNSNASFNAPFASFSFSNGNPMFSYTHDAVAQKVVYLGYRNTNAQATRWTSFWSQWDIATNTNDYTTSLGNKNEAFADNGSYYYGYNLSAWLPDATTGRAYAIKLNTNAAPFNVYTGLLTRTGTVYTWQYPTNTYASGNPDTAPATSGTGASQSFSFNSVINNGTIYSGGSAQVTAISNDIPASTSAATLNSSYLTYTTGIGTNKYYRHLKSTNFYLGLTGSNRTYGYYVSKDKIFVASAGVVFSTRNYSPRLYTGNITFQTFSMPNTNNNLMRLQQGFAGGIKSATSQFQVY